MKWTFGKTLHQPSKFVRHLDIDVEYLSSSQWRAVLWPRKKSYKKATVSAEKLKSTEFEFNLKQSESSWYTDYRKELILNKLVYFTCILSHKVLNFKSDNSLWWNQKILYETINWKGAGTWCNLDDKTLNTNFAFSM